MAARIAIKHHRHFPRPAELRELIRTEQTAPKPVPAPTPDHLRFFANRLLWNYLRARGGMGSLPGQTSPALDDLRRGLRMIVDDFAEAIRAGDDLATPAEFAARWRRLAERHGPLPSAHARTIARLEESPEAREPFPMRMIRDLSESQPDGVAA